MIDVTALNLARRAWKNKDYNYARQCYQEVSYGFNDFSEQEKETFSKEVAEFAKTDPIYHEILNIVKRQILKEGSPVLQSKLTKVVKLDHGEKGTELLRYVLYYAEYNDDILRVKKGRSYLLDMPKQKTKSYIDHVDVIEDNGMASKLKGFWKKIKEDTEKPLTRKEKIYGLINLSIILLILFVVFYGN